MNFLFLCFRPYSLATNTQFESTNFPRTMSARIDTILILGATAGIGEAMARRFHSLEKKVIVTGREQNKGKLTQLARELPGLEFRVVCLPNAPGRSAANRRMFMLVGSDGAGECAKPSQEYPGRFPQARHSLHKRGRPKPLLDVRAASE